MDLFLTDLARLPTHYMSPSVHSAPDDMVNASEFLYGLYIGILGP